jgi:hypothetical protein
VNSRCSSARYLALFPLSSSHVLSLSRYILSRLSIIVGSNVGGLTYLHLHLYPHMMNPIDRCSFPYLANFMPAVVGLALSNSVASCFVICGIHHLCPLFAVSNTYVPCSDIYILHPKNFRDMQFMPLLVRTHQGFERICINKRTIDVLL